MGSNSSLAIAFSQEELFVILAYLKAERLSGLDFNLLHGLDEQQTRLVMGVAERALLARGYFQIKDGHLQLTAPVIALVGACAFPEWTAVITQNRPDAPSATYFFHMARKMRVMHTIPLTGIHQFIAVEDAKALAKAALGILALDSQPKITSEGGSIPLDSIEPLSELAGQAGGREKALALLEEAGLGGELARQMAITLAAPVANTTFASVHHKRDETSGFTVLSGENGLWLITPGEDDTAEIQAVSADEVIEQVRKMFGV